MTDHPSHVIDIIERLRAEIDPDVNEPLAILLGEAIEIIEQSQTRTYESDIKRRDELGEAYARGYQDGLNRQAPIST